MTIKILRKIQAADYNYKKINMINQKRNKTKQGQQKHWTTATNYLNYS